MKIKKNIPKLREKKQKIPVDALPELDEIKIKVKLWNRIRFIWDRKKALIGAGVLAGGLIIAGSWGLILQVIGGSLIGVEGAHEIGRKSKYGPG